MNSIILWRLFMTKYIAVILLIALFSISFPAVAQLGSPLTETLDSAPVINWMNQFYRIVEAEGINAPAASRLYAYAGITTYESLLPGMPFNNTLAGQIRHMPDMPLPEDDELYDWLSAHNAAMSTVTTGLFPDASDETYAAINAMRQSNIETRTEEVGPDVVERSLKFGDELGQAILEWAADDGYADTRGLEYEIPVGDGFWEITTEGTSPNEPYWGQLRPFVLEYSDECAVYMNLEYSTDPESTFYLQAVEVLETGRNLTEEQEKIARFWVDTPGMTGTPAGHWVTITTQMADRLNLTLDRLAEAYAMVGVAVGDSFISAWWLKYQVNLIRPVTYIRANIRRSWAPYIETPPFPEYPSGHSVVSGAASEVLTGLFGTVAFTDETHFMFDHEPLRRSFLSFEHAASEAAISRLYGGIHYRAAIENGLRQGRCIGEVANSAIRLNPIRQGGE
jgi:hypothetical protein